MEDSPVAKNEESLCVLIVNWNVKDYLRNCLLSIPNAVGSLRYQIIVVDNASADDSVRMVQEEFPSVTLIASDVNLGFGKGNNLGLEHATGKYVAIVNPDTVLAEKSLETLVHFLEDHPDAGLVGPKITNADGSVDSPFINRPSIGGAVGDLVHLSEILSLFRITPAKRVKEPTEGFVIRGSCMVFSHACLREIGGIPTLTFMYGEELVLGQLLRQHEYQVWYVPQAEILHFHNKSGSQLWLPMESKIQINAGRIRATKEIMARSEFLIWNLVKAIEATTSRVTHLLGGKPPQAGYHKRITQMHLAEIKGTLTGPRRTGDSRLG